MRILFVDDNPAIGELLRKRLAPHCAPDGSVIELEIETDYLSALKRLSTDWRYDAVVVETSAGTQGISLDLLRTLKGTRVLGIVLTAVPSVEDCIESMLAGASDYVAKVGSIDQIAQRLVVGFGRAREVWSGVDHDALYVDRNFEALADQYPDQWIAVSHGHFFGAAKTYGELVEKIADMPGEAKFWRMPPARCGA